MRGCSRENARPWVCLGPLLKQDMQRTGEERKPALRSQDSGVKIYRSQRCAQKNLGHPSASSPIHCPPIERRYERCGYALVTIEKSKDLPPTYP
ncbi:hypothetical protein AAFF_G00036320 [Aldrovandia affinis]|uniref:Uncharacterized protein n=1 Tax=Aldrovandia affinis TaxID=143900 RepID=A0AAD7S397_9TELE|nr:hypothetical protein AAFF_G00036320 [Aldrovandia affinis]